MDPSNNPDTVSNVFIPVTETNLNPQNLSLQKNIIRRFYKDLWDKQDTSIIPALIHSNFNFRGSLGPVLTGHAEFATYVNWLTGILDSYTSDILDLVEEGNKVTAKMRFHGIHRNGSLFGQPPTGKWVWWDGAAIFTFENDKIKDLWVLGDVYGLMGRLKKAESEIEFVPNK
jgi:predicted ester cyclase